MGRRAALFVAFNGKEMSLQDWAREFNVLYHTLYHRYKKGQRGEELFNVAELSARDKTRPLKQKDSEDV